LEYLTQEPPNTHRLLLLPPRRGFDLQTFQLMLQLEASTVTRSKLPNPWNFNLFEFQGNFGYGSTKASKIVNTLDEGPRPKSGKLRLNLHGTIFEGK
jgi:hypothetical protein